MKMYIKLIVRGLYRRKKTARSVFVAAMLSAVFITLVLLYSDNVERYIMENNFNQYGKWFIAVKSPENPDFKEAKAVLDEHPYIGIPGHINDLYTLHKGDCELLSGIFDKRAFEISRLDVIAGRLPEKNDEAVITESAFKQLGYTFREGMESNFCYTIKGNEMDITIHITGVITDYTGYWRETIRYPEIIFCENPFDVADYSYCEVALYPIKDDYFDIDTEKLYSGLSKKMSKTGISSRYIQYFFVYNTSAYRYSMWYSKDIEMFVKAAIIIAGIIAILQVTYTYTESRKPDYERLYILGASKYHVMTYVFVENFIICIVGQIAGIISAFGLVAILMCIISSALNMEYFYILKYKTCFSIIAACTLSSCTAILPITFRTAKTKKTAAYTRKARKFISATFISIMSSLIMLCTMNIYHSYIEYRNNLHDDVIFSFGQALVKNMTDEKTYSLKKSMYIGITDNDFCELIKRPTIKNANMMSIDTMHRYYWNGMDNATYRKLSELWYNMVNDNSDITYSTDIGFDKDYLEQMQSIIVVYDTKSLISMLDRLNIKIDAEAFERGDTVIFCDGYTSDEYNLAYKNNKFVLDYIPVEESIKNGDELYFECQKGITSAKLCAKLTYNDVLHLPLDFSKSAGIYKLDDVEKLGGFTQFDNIAYHVICSPSFAGKLAMADGLTDYVIRYNSFSIEYDHSKNYIANLEETVEYLKDYVISNDNMNTYLKLYNIIDYKDYNAENFSIEVENTYSRYHQSTFLYMIFLAILCIIFVLIRQNMIALVQNAEYKNNRRYILLGADTAFFRKKFFISALGDAACVFPSIIIAAAYMFYIVKSENSRMYLTDIAGACSFNLYEVITVLILTALAVIIYIIISGVGACNERNIKSRKNIKNIRNDCKDNCIR